MVTLVLAILAAAFLVMVLLVVFDRVIVAAKLMELVKVTNANSQAVTGRLLDGQLAMEQEHRAERERLMRALLARSTGELATLERVEAASVRAKAAGGGNRAMTQDEYERSLREDMERMGYPPDVMPGTDPHVPAVPEGMG